MYQNENSAILTVSELTSSIKSTLEKEYRFIRVCGEISNLKTPFSGHSYFTLKDSSAQLRTVLFKQQKRFIDLDIKDGQEVVCFGRVTVYEPRGDYQFIVDSIELFGTGKLQIEYDRLRKKLLALGYFDDKLKKHVPSYVRTIAVITSPTGAAVQDFLKIVRLRRADIVVHVFPVRVQGDEAVDQICKAIGEAEKRDQYQAIVLCRGGGSLEDLLAFNDERVAEAIHRCTVPVVTGIGHETDFTIADFCADLRCSTPTGTAERLVPDSEALLTLVNSHKTRLARVMRHLLTVAHQQYRHKVRQLSAITGLLQGAEHRVEMSSNYLVSAMAESLGRMERRVNAETVKLRGLSPSNRIELQQSKLHHSKTLMFHAILRTLRQKEADLGRQAAILNSVSPLATLARGYAIARKFDQGLGEYRVLRASIDVEQGDTVNVMLHQGEINCRVVDTGTKTDE
ncbi:exodeoxyribonuclease VII large subunit [Desulforhopalus singaporensis]|uniref:Exodeoxyribonuclease 7 large subunit n=1 Tax=Desulforhopalus singaporensis TaxID=91360 RepID=A0A1H0PI87_9BACT|nr:exodeoxyribonuclease VII large subunit [Desulforhopalus singaporensis]SDP04713.1 Exodeoxyribonuclease VII large subunit [Desulforhopalus singaporensis]